MFGGGGKENVVAAEQVKEQENEQKEKEQENETNGTAEEKVDQKEVTAATDEIIQA